MCGICGIVDFRGELNLEPAVARMTESLRHRGPDAGGVAVYGAPGAARGLHSDTGAWRSST